MDGSDGGGGGGGYNDDDDDGGLRGSTPLGVVGSEEGVRRGGGGLILGEAEHGEHAATGRVEPCCCLLLLDAAVRLQCFHAAAIHRREMEEGASSA